MSEEMKLLRAFIEAVGYEVEEVLHFPFGYRVTKRKKAAPKPRKAKAEDYTWHFNTCWDIYPKRPGNNKRDAFRQFQARIKEGECVVELYKKTGVYAAYCVATGRTGTEFAMLGATFYGPSLRYNDDFTPPKETTLPEWAKIPRSNDKLEAWAKANEFKGSSAGQSYDEYRRSLEGQIEKRTGSEPGSIWQDSRAN